MIERPIVWDFYREVVPTESTGSGVHYYNNESQILYSNEKGLCTKTGVVINGNWDNSMSGEELVICDTKYSKIRFDHPSNGVLYGAAVTGGTLQFLRYMYSEDITNITEAWNLYLSSDNNIQELKLDVMNVDAAVLTPDNSIFQPGARVEMWISVGNSDGVPMGVFWVDEIDIDIASETIPISCRNHIGYYLKDQTMDDFTTIEGPLEDTVKALLEHSGIKNYSIQEFKVNVKYDFDPEESVLDAFKKVSDSVANENPALSFNMVELPSGKIVCGHQSWISQVYPNSAYRFNAGSQIFERNTNKSLDGAYSQLRCTGESEKDKKLLPVTVQIESHPYWNLGKHKTKHIKAPRFMTQQELQIWAETQAKKYGKVGITDEFDSPFRPQLIPKDVAEIKNGSGYSKLGLITDVTHSFSIDEGYTTQFTVDSGGVETSDSGYIIYADIASLNGFNRKQSITDIIKFISGK